MTALAPTPIVDAEPLERRRARCREASRRYRERHPDRVREIQRAHDRKRSGSEHRRAWRRANHAENRDRHGAGRSRYRALNLEVVQGTERQRQREATDEQPRNRDVERRAAEAAAFERWQRQG